MNIMLMYCLTFYKLPTAVVSTLNNYLGHPILDMFIILYKFWGLDFRTGHNPCTSLTRNINHDNRSFFFRHLDRVTAMLQSCASSLQLASCQQDGSYEQMEVQY